jgi:hypothetical protein
MLHLETKYSNAQGGFDISHPCHLFIHHHYCCSLRVELLRGMQSQPAGHGCSRMELFPAGIAYPMAMMSTPSFNRLLTQVSIRFEVCQRCANAGTLVSVSFVVGYWRK